jgi:protein-S-isoprenylcysteine O-methyltransferase Ste14
VLLFTGFALIATSIWAFILPVVMTTLFVLVHIPALDHSLSHKYGESFDEWTRSTKKFIPFVY